jgi:hypothetical protein
MTPSTLASGRLWRHDRQEGQRPMKMGPPLRARVALCGALLAGACLSQAAPAAASTPLPDYLVRVSQTGDPGTLATQLQARYGGKVLAVYRYAWHGFAIKMTPAAESRLVWDPAVDSVTLDKPVQMQDVQSPVPSWGLDRLDQNAPTPLDNRYAYQASGAGVHVYLVDSGIKTGTTDLAGRIGAGVSFVADTLGTDDCNGHGTYDAGIVAGTIYGVAKQAIVHPVRIFGCRGRALGWQAMAGIDWVVSHAQRPALMLLPFDTSMTDGPLPPLDDAVYNAAQGSSAIASVVPIGNDGEQDVQNSPAEVGAAIDVGATDQQDHNAPFTNTSTSPNLIDTWAPGVAIPSDSWLTPGGGAPLVRSGTSAAAAFVAGLVAQLLQDTPAKTDPADLAWELRYGKHPRGGDPASPSDLWISGVVPLNPYGGGSVSQAGMRSAQVIAWANDNSNAYPPTDPVEIDATVDGAIVARRIYQNDDTVVMTIPVPGGTHQVCVTAVNVGLVGSNTLLACNSFTMPVAMQFNAPTFHGPVYADGWVIDPDTTGPVNVDLVVDGTVKHTFTANLTQPGLGDAYPGYGDNHAYSVAYQILPLPGETEHACLIARNVGPGADTTLGCHDYSRPGGPCPPHCTRHTAKHTTSRSDTSARDLRREARK